MISCELGERERESDREKEKGDKRERSRETGEEGDEINRESRFNGGEEKEMKSRPIF